jgi:deoxyribodipyrimidine photo-lyase
MIETAIWWIRRDLRLTDNQALTAVLRHAAQVIPVFIMDPALTGGGEKTARLSLGRAAKPGQRPAPTG